jgi:hypothetical protein
MTITRTVEIPDNRVITLEVPKEAPIGGQANVIIQFSAKETLTSEPLKERVFGCAKGQFKIADDFGAPLEDFKDYM